MAFIKNQIIKRLEKFIKNLSSDMLSISLVKGEAKLSDVKIDEIALMDMLKLPRFITLNSAICNEVFIKIPWTKLKSDPIYLAFDCVEVKISLDQGSDTSKNIVDSLMESANNMQNMNIDPNNAMSTGSGGLIDKIIEGVKISINTLLVTVISYNFKAIIEITSVIIQSTSPSWKPAGLKFSRISMKELGTYIHFKEIQWSNMRVEVRIIKQNSESPLKIITNQTKLRVTTQKFLPGNVTNNLTPLTRVILIMEDLLWVINESQISELIIFLSTCLLVSNDFQSRLTVKPYNPGALIAYNAAPFMVKTSEKYALFQRYQILEESLHMCIGKIDFHLCQNLTNITQSEPTNHYSGNPKSLQVIVERVGLDVYPRHYTHMSRDNWLDYNQSSSTAAPIPPKPYRWALNSLTSYWHDLEILLRNNTTPAFAQGLPRKDPKGKPIPPPSLLHQGNGDIDSRTFISTLITRAKSHLLQKCAVIRIFGDLRILDLSLYESNTDHGLIFELERARFHLPNGQPLIHLEANEYFYYNKLDFAHFLPVPNPSLFLEANPLKVVTQYDSLAWLVVLASRVSTLWKMYYTDQCLPKLPRFHTDVHVESLMPRMVFPKYYFSTSTKIESAELNGCFALQCQASQITISNFTLIGDPPPQSPGHSWGQYDPRTPLKECLKEIMDIKEVLRLGQNNHSFPETNDAPQQLNLNLFETFYPSASSDFYDIVADRRHFLGPSSKGEELSAPPQFSTVTARLPQTNINASSCPGACSYLCHNDPSRNNHAISPKCLWNLAWADRWVCQLSYLVVEKEEITEKARRRSNVLETPLLGPLSCWLWLSPGPDPNQGNYCSEQSLNGELQPFKHVKGFEDITLQGQSYGHDPDLTKTSPLEQSGQHHKFYYQAVVKIASPDANPKQTDDGEILVVRLDNSKYGSLLMLTESLSLMSERITELESKVPPLLNHPSTVSEIGRNQPNGSGSSHVDPEPSNTVLGQIVSVKMSFLIKMVVFKFYDSASTTSTIPSVDVVDTPLSPPTLVNETSNDQLVQSMSLAGSSSTTTKDDLGSDKHSDVISDTSDYMIDEMPLIDSKMKDKAFSLKSTSSRPLTPDRISLSSLGSIRPQIKGLPSAEPRKSFVGDTIASSLVEIRARTRSVNARSSLIFPFLSPHTAYHRPENVLGIKKGEINDNLTKNPQLFSQTSSKSEEPKPEIGQVEMGLDLLETPISVTDHATYDNLSHLKVSVIQEPTPFLTFSLTSCLADIDICQIAHDICASLATPCGTPNCENKVEVAFKLWARRGVIRDGAIVKMLNERDKASNESGMDHVNKHDEGCFLKFRASYSSKLDPHQHRYTSSNEQVSPDQIALDLSTVLQVSVLPANLDSGDRLQIAKLVPRAFRNFHRQVSLAIIPLSPGSMESFSELFTFSATQIQAHSWPDDNTISSQNLQTNSLISLKPVSPFTIFAHISQPIALTLLSTPTADVHPDNFDLLLRPLIAYRLATDGVLVLTNFFDIIGEFFESYFDEMSAKTLTNRSLTELRENSTSSREIERLRRENIALSQQIQNLQFKLNPN